MDQAEKAVFKFRFHALVEGNPKTVRLMRSGEEVNSLDMKKVMAAETRTFENYDEAILVFITECLSEGKEVAINAAGPQNLMITAAHGLFRKPGEQLEQDKAHTIMDGLEKLRKRYHDDEGRELLTDGRDSWIHPEEFVEMARKYHYVKHKTFNPPDESLIPYVEGFLKRNKMVIVAGWEEKAEVYVEPDYPIRSDQPKTKSGGCFIATAACGDRRAPEVIILSAFRDVFLAQNLIGRAFIRLYYVVSPPIATVIARSTGLRRVALTLVVRPAVWLARLWNAGIS